MSKGAIYDNLNAAQHIFGLGGRVWESLESNHFNTSKMKFSYVVHFELSDAAKTMIKHMYGVDTPLGEICSYVIKDVDKPSFSMETTQMNQYNRTRLAQGRITYDPVNMVLYDTVDSAGLKLIDAYRRYYYGDFAQKSLESWRYDSISTPRNFENVHELQEPLSTDYRDPNYTWGRSVYNQGDQDSGYFFKRIDIYEIDGTTYTVHNLHNPVFTTVGMGTKSHESDDPDIINLTIQYEGVTNICPVTNQKAISADVADIAPKLAEDDAEFSKSHFYRYWGEMDDGTQRWLNPNQTKGFPDVDGGDSTLTSMMGTALNIGSSIVGGVSAVSSVFSGGVEEAADTLGNVAGAVGEGTAVSEAIGDAGQAASVVNGIGGLL